jgi:hypothetical protein
VEESLVELREGDMAQLLIFNQDNVHDDPIISERDCYKQGDIIIVKSDDHEWGREEHPFTATNPKFWIVSTPLVSFEQLEVLSSQYVEYDGETPIVLLQRIWKLDVSLLTEEENTLLSTGVLTVTSERLCECVKNKITNEFLSIN